MTLYEQIVNALHDGKAFSFDHNGMLPYVNIDTLPIDCPRTDLAMLGYFVQQWASKSIHKENSIISFVVSKDKIKIYY